MFTRAQLYGSCHPVVATLRFKIQQEESVIENRGLPVVGFNHDGLSIFINKLRLEEFIDRNGAVIAGSVKELHEKLEPLGFVNTGGENWKHHWFKRTSDLNQLSKIKLKEPSDSCTACKDVREESIIALKRLKAKFDFDAETSLEAARNNRDLSKKVQSCIDSCGELVKRKKLPKNPTKLCTSCEPLSRGVKKHLLEAQNYLLKQSVPEQAVIEQNVQELIKDIDMLLKINKF